MMNKRELELYIHIPFCARKCAYCDFLSFAVPESTYRDYMDKLIEEIYGQSLCFPDSCVISIFLGGGTPSLLPADLIGELFAVLYGCFTIAEDAEITIEANPGTLTMEKLEAATQPHSFIRIHKGYLVNYRCIQRISAATVTLLDGTQLPIGRSKAAEVKSKYLSILGET